MCLYYAVWYSHDPFRHGMIPACADRTAALITSKKRKIRHLTLRRAPVDVGGCILRSKLRAAQPNPTKSALLHAQNVNGIRLQRQERRQILCRRSTTHHTLITRCSPRQPLCNLWTSLLDFYVRRACAVTCCTLYNLQ